MPPISLSQGLHYSWMFIVQYEFQECLMYFLKIYGYINKDCTESAQYFGDIIILMTLILPINEQRRCFHFLGPLLSLEAML